MRYPRILETTAILALLFAPLAASAESIGEPGREVEFDFVEDVTGELGFYFCSVHVRSMSGCRVGSPRERGAALSFGDLGGIVECQSNVSRMSVERCSCARFRQDCLEVSTLERADESVDVSNFVVEACGAATDMTHDM